MVTTDLLHLKDITDSLLAEDQRRGALVCRGLPRQITWTNTSRCNARCAMCQVDRRKPPPPDLPIEALEELAPRLFPTMRILNLTRRGEPLVDRNLPRILELCDEYAVKVDVNTNGTRLDREMAIALLPLLHDIKISVDGADSATNDLQREGTHLPAVVENTRVLLDERRRILDKPNWPLVSFEVTLTRSNIDQLPSIVRLAADLGVDTVKAYHAFAFWPEHAAESLVHEKAKYNRVREEAIALSSELGVKARLALPFLMEGPAPDFPRRRCPRLWMRLWIDFNGDVLPCCGPARKVLGNMFNDDIVSLWNRPGWQALRRGGASICVGCGWLREVDRDAPIPMDDAFLVDTGRILDGWRRGQPEVEQPVGAPWDTLWSRRTAQLPLPEDLSLPLD